MWFAAGVLLCLRDLELDWWRESPTANFEEHHVIRFGGRLNHQRGKFVDTPYDLRQLADDRLKLFEFRVQQRSGFEVQFGGGLVAFGHDIAEQGLSRNRSTDERARFPLRSLRRCSP